MTQPKNQLNSFEIYQKIKTNQLQKKLRVELPIKVDYLEDGKTLLITY